MRFTTKPTPEEIATWFGQFSLHDELKHEDYVSGIVAIENKEGGQKFWVPYMNAVARVAYFWDWVRVNGYRAEIQTTELVDQPVQLPPKEGETEPVVVMRHYVRADIKVFNADGQVVRFSSGRKQVSLTKQRCVDWNSNPKKYVIVPDEDALMKAETGAINRALAVLGMLALPSSGLASAEDMIEWAREQEMQERGMAPVTVEATPVEPIAPPPAPSSRRQAPNPKAPAAKPAAQNQRPRQAPPQGK